MSRIIKYVSLSLIIFKIFYVFIFLNRRNDEEFKWRISTRLRS